MSYFTKEYLESIIKSYGPHQHIMNTNCAGKPEKQGDYCFDHGEVEKILQDLEKGINTYNC